MRFWLSRKRGLSPVNRYLSMPFSRLTECPILRCDLFNKAFNHIAERIDEVYKELTKGKASPVGGVAYLSLEDSEVSYSGDVF